MRIVKVLLIIGLIASLASFGFCKEMERTAKVINVQGSADVYSKETKAWSPAAVGMVLKEGDVIKTKVSSTMILNVDGDGQAATVDIAQNSELRLAKMIKDDATKSENTLLDLAIGEILIKAQKLETASSKFEVKTPTSVTGVRGTKFSVKVEAIE